MTVNVPFSQLSGILRDPEETLSLWLPSWKMHSDGLDLVYNLNVNSEIGISSRF